jgi:hypothetical protein
VYSTTTITKTLLVLDNVLIPDINDILYIQKDGDVHTKVFLKTFDEKQEPFVRVRISFEKVIELFKGIYK